MVAGPYASVLDEHDGIPLGLHARASLAEPLRAEAVDLLQVTKESFDYYHSRFARRYPFGEYHQAFVPDFNGGAMENPGCVTLRDTFVFRSRATRSERARRAGVVAHEMAHMWFGDLVTMRWWNDLWLNESFAEYLAQRCCSEATGYALWTEFGIVRKDWGSVVEQSPSTHPVAGNEAADSLVALQQFDGISYAKGAAVLKQLALRIGDEPFFAGLQSYFDRFAWGNATFADLIEAWVAVGADDLPALGRGLVADRGHGHHRPARFVGGDAAGPPGRAGRSRAEPRARRRCRRRARRGDRGGPARAGRRPRPRRPSRSDPCWWCRMGPTPPGPRSGSARTAGRGWPMRCR